MTPAMHQAVPIRPDATYVDPSPLPYTSSCSRTSLALAPRLASRQCSQQQCTAIDCGSSLAPCTLYAARQHPQPLECQSCNNWLYDPAPPQLLQLLEAVSAPLAPGPSLLRLMHSEVCKACCCMCGCRRCRAWPRLRTWPRRASTGTAAPAWRSPCPWTAVC